MATTEHFYSGTGTQTSFPFQFPYLTESDIFVKLYNTETGEFDLLQQNTSGLNHDYSISNTNIVFNTAPPQVAGIDNIHIYRTTDVEIAKAVYGTGSAIRAQDLNNNTNQALFRLQESDQLITTGDIKNGAITEAKLAPNSVTTAHIRNGTIIDEDVSATAAIQGSKIVPNFGVQNIIGDGSQIINPNPNFGNQTITTDLNIDARGNISADGDLSIEDITASGDMTIDNITAQGDITAARFFGDGSGLTGITFTGVDQFLRRDIDDTASGNITFANNIKIPLANDDLDAFPDGAHGTGNANMFDKGQIFFNYPEDTTVYNSFGQSAWIYLRHFQNFGSSINNPELNLKVGTNLTTASGGDLDPQFVITTGGSSDCIVFDKNGTNITNYPLRIHNSSGVQWEFRDSIPSFQINCSDAFGLTPNTYMNNRRGTLFIRSSYDVEFQDNGAGSNDNGTTTFTSTLAKFKSYHDSDDELDLVDGDDYNGGHVELYSNNTKRFETDIFGCVVHSNLRIPEVSNNPNTDWNYDIFNADYGYMWDNGSLIFGDKPDRSATFPDTPMDKNNWLYHFYSPGGSLNSERKSTTTFQLGAAVSSQVPRGIFEIHGNDQHLVTFSKKEKSGTKFDAPIEISPSNVENPSVDEGSSIKWGLYSLYGATPGPSLEIRCKNPNGNPGYRDSYITTFRDSLILQAGGTNNGVIIEDRASTPNTIAKFISDNSGDQTSGDALYGGAVELYAEGTKRFETNSTGVNVTGGLDVTGNVQIPSYTAKLQLGDSQELELYHDGTDSYINDQGTGVLKIQSNQAVELYYDGSKKFQTTSYGVLATGTIATISGNVRCQSDSHKITAGAEHELRIYHDGSDSYIVNDTGALYIKADANRDGIQLNNNGKVALFYQGTEKFKTTNNGAEVTGRLDVTGNIRIPNDTGKVLLGLHQDLELYHDGSHSVVKDAGTGMLKILGSTVAIKNHNDNRTSASFIPATAVSLYYDSSKKFETTSTGTLINGIATVDGAGTVGFKVPDSPSVSNETTTHGLFMVGNGNDLTIAHNGTDSFITNDTGNLVINAKSGEEGIKVIPDDAVELYFDASKKLSTKSFGCTVHGTLQANTNLKVNSYTGQLLIGVSNEFTIQHDDTDTFIENTAGNLHIRPKASEEGIKLIPDGAIELYFDGVKKAETVSYGFDVSGVIQGQTAIQCNTNATGELAKTTHGLIHGAQKQAIFQFNGVDDKIYLINNTTDKEFALLANSSGDIGWKVIPDGAVELYYDGTKKFETTSTGAKVTGRLDTTDTVVIQSGGLKLPDNEMVMLGGTADNSGDLSIYHNGTNSRIENGTGELQINSRSKIRLEAMNSELVDETMLLGTVNSAVQLYYDNVLTFKTASNGIRGYGNSHIFEGTGSPHLQIRTSHTGSNTAKLTMRGARTSSTTVPINQIDFCTNDSSGTSNDGTFRYDNSMPLGDISVYKQTSHSNIGRLKIHLNTANGENLAERFDLESTGALTIAGSLTEGSDRRIKTDIVTISDALTKVNNLRGVEYTRIESGEKEIGVIAQEVETVFPELVRTGDDEDKTLSVKYGHLTAALIEAVKELTTEVNTLKTKVAALEAA